MNDRETLAEIFKIMKRLLLIPLDGVEPIPRKGTTRHECYRALYQIQKLLGTNRFFANLPPQTNADRIRAMTDEELARRIAAITACMDCILLEECNRRTGRRRCVDIWLDWLKIPVEDTADGC